MRSTNLIFLAAGVWLLALSTLAKPVTNWQDRANYPARLKAMVWGKTRLDAHTTVTFGTWTIHFNKREPIVTYEAFGPHQNIRIGQNDPKQVNQCTNPVVGMRHCQFDIQLRPRLSCVVQTFTGTPTYQGQSGGFIIPCPTALDLER